MPKTPYGSIPGDQDRTATDNVKHTQTSATATSGGAGLPALARGYIVIDVNGTLKKVPYYDV
jgi:hypothetical protein